MPCCFFTCWWWWAWLGLYCVGQPMRFGIAHLPLRGCYARYEDKGEDGDMSGGTVHSTTRVLRLYNTIVTEHYERVRSGRHFNEVKYVHTPRTYIPMYCIGINNATVQRHPFAGCCSSGRRHGTPTSCLSSIQSIPLYTIGVERSGQRKPY